jgi:hypothetical protein
MNRIDAWLAGQAEDLVAARDLYRRRRWMRKTGELTLETKKPSNLPGLLGVVWIVSLFAVLVAPGCGLGTDHRRPAFGVLSSGVLSPQDPRAERVVSQADKPRAATYLQRRRAGRG